MDVQELLNIGLQNVAKRFEGSKNTRELLSCVHELITNQPFDSVINDVHGQTDKFQASIDINVRNKDDVNEFISNYVKNNGETIRISKAKQLTNKSKYSVENYYRCQHNTRVSSTQNIGEIFKKNPSKRLKNTNCPFTMAIKVLKDPDILLPGRIVID